MELESNIETYQMKLRYIKIELKKLCQLVAIKKKEYEELTALCNEKCTTTLSNPCEVNQIVKDSRKETLSTKEDYLIAQYEVDKYHLKDKKNQKVYTNQQTGWKD